MADHSIEKPNEEKHEKLATIFGTEITGKEFRIIGDAWDRYKSAYNFRDEGVYGKMQDGDFLVFDSERKEYFPMPYHTYDYYEVVANGKTFRGRLVNPEGAPWDDGNFQVLTADGQWVTVSYNDITDKGGSAERVNKLKHVHYIPVSFKEEVTLTTKKGTKQVKRAKLELSKTAYEALLNVMLPFEKAGVSPRDFWYGFDYVEEDKQYVVNQSMVNKLTDDEKAAAAEEEAAVQTSALDALEPGDFSNQDIQF